MRTVNAILLENKDRLLLQSIHEKARQGWTAERIAAYYNIYIDGYIPDSLRNIVALSGYVKGAGEGI